MADKPKETKNIVANKQTVKSKSISHAIEDSSKSNVLKYKQDSSVSLSKGRINFVDSNSSNSMESREALSLPKFSAIKAYIIRWQTRLLGKDIDRLILLLAVLVFMERANLEEALKRVRKIINKRINTQHIIDIVFQRILLEASQFNTNENLYAKKRDKVLSYMVDDIQLYGVVLDMFNQKESSMRDIIKSVVQKDYDEKFTLSKEQQFLLESQERNMGLHIDS